MSINIVKKFSGQSNILTIPKLFLDLTGDHETALFLSQCIYWFDKMGRPFYKTYPEWKEELGMARRAVDKAREKLDGIVITEIHKANGVPTLHYSIDYAALEKKLDEFVSGEHSDDLMKTEDIDLSKIPSPLKVDYDIEIGDGINAASKINGVVYEECDEYGEEKPIVKNANFDQYSIANKLADVCMMDFDMNKGRLLKEAKVLSKDKRISPELIGQIYSKGGSWYKNDWRGKQGQSPRPEQIKETILQLIELKSASDNITGDVRDR